MPFTQIPPDSLLKNTIAVIDKKTEKARAGFYGVTLKDENIRVELTTTAHVGFHRYFFPERKSSFISYINEGNKERCSFISVKKN